MYTTGMQNWAYLIFFCKIFELISEPWFRKFYYYHFSFFKIKSNHYHQNVFDWITNTVNSYLFFSTFYRRLFWSNFFGIWIYSKIPSSWVKSSCLNVVFHYVIRFFFQNFLILQENFFIFVLAPLHY